MKPVVLCGFMGCGKSTVGQALARRLGVPFVDMDRYIEERAGMTVGEIFDQKGEAAFRQMEYEACLCLGQGRACVIAAGGGALTYERNVRALSQHCEIYHLQLNFARLYDRIKNSKERPLVGKLGKEGLLALYESRLPWYRAAGKEIDGDRPVGDVVEDLAKDIQKNIR